MNISGNEIALSCREWRGR